MKVSASARLFEPTGALAQHLRGYAPRLAQQEMAAAVERTIDGGGCLVAEAGTGTGKTLAYLIPAVTSGHKTLVSTATRNLQDQLFRRDLPLVREVTGRGFRAALLKGRTNYLCLYRFEQNGGLKAGHEPADAGAWAALERWAKSTRTGDIGEAAGVPETSPLWPLVTSTSDNCLGQDCPKVAECFLFKARREAQDADVVVVNHHLLWADLTLRSDGFGEILPVSRVVIVDEAHQFLESATQFLGLSLSSRQLLDLARDIDAERRKDAVDASELSLAADELGTFTLELRRVLGEPARREAWHRVADDPELAEVLDRVRGCLLALAESLRPLAVRGKGLESCQRRAVEFAARLDDFLGEGEADTVRWFETRKRGFTLNRTPLAVAEEFRRFREASPAAWVFASATLTVAGSFDHFLGRFGLEQAECRHWESPFDYARQSLLYLPPGLPDPASAEYNRAMLEAIAPVLAASGGRTFVLFTSHQALLEAAVWLRRAVRFPLFVQGSQPKAVLLDRFQRAGNGVLLGAASFWEGVDVPGPALSCVIIDRLPFASPADPVLAARLDSLRRAGQNPFLSQQLPDAIIALKQGAGRLIRHADDRGVLVLCDPRLQTRAYGRLFLASLPAMPRTGDLGQVEAFFQRSAAGVSA